MTTLTGMLAAIMTAIQMKKKLLRTVFALQVSIVGERGFRSFISHREVETFLKKHTGRILQDVSKHSASKP